MDSQSTPPDQQSDNDKPRRPGLRRVIGSVFSAALGVQSSKNRERDFNEGSAGLYIAVGIIFTLLFIATVISIVQWVLASR